MQSTSIRAGLSIALASVLAACGGGDSPSPSTTQPATGQVATIQVLSNRADLISGGDALVQLSVPSGGDISKLKIDLNGADVTSSFATRADGKFYGLVSGLKIGANQLHAAEPGTTGAAITITNFPNGGPIISGAQAMPWVCTTKVATPTANNPDLGNPLDAQCNVASPVYRYQYWTLAGAFATYDPASPPAAATIATTTTDQGKTVPYIVRIERGVINRGKYDIAYLANPANVTQGWTPWTVPGSWNQKLFWKFGSGCDFQHTQGGPGGVLDDSALRRGFMVASSEMTQYGTHCNDVTSAETVMMVKEHIIEQYGVIRFTMSDGGSGGAHQQNLHSSNYPGLLQGILPTITFQDTWTPGREFADCGLLRRFYTAQTGSPTTTFTVMEKAAVDGHRWNEVCEGPTQINMADRQPFYMDPSVGCSGDMNLWSLANLSGLRCTLQDYNIAIFGPRDATGYAKTPQDNTGVQYGLNALMAGTITPEKFVTLNEQVGGYDINGQWQPNRMVADAGAAEITQKSGRVTNGKRLGDVAIIDSRTFDITEEHYDFRTWVIRNRLLKENGDYANQVIWRYKSTPAGIADRAFDTMNQWLMNVEADTSAASLHAKIAANKPGNAVDSCWRANLGVWSTDAAYCNTGANPSMTSSIDNPGTPAAVANPTIDEWPVYRDTRTAAGGPLASDIMKCQLKPLLRSDYLASFTDTQWARLSAVFTTGVCDYSKPGVGQVIPDPWQTFIDGPGGRALGTPPVSHPA